METLTNLTFQTLIKKLDLKEYDEFIAVQDDAGNVVEFDTTGNENHKVEDIICFDSLEYSLTDLQKDVIYGIAYDAFQLLKSA